MKLLRNGQLVAEGRASRDLDSGVLFFRVKKWHVRDPDTDPWLAHHPATWTVSDDERSTDYAGTKLQVGVSGDKVRTIAVDAKDPTGRAVHLDVR